MILRHAFIPHDNQRLAHVCGALDEHLRTIEAAFDVSIRRRNETFRVEGARRAAERAVAVLQQLHDRAAAPIEPAELQLLLVQALQDEGPALRVVQSGETVAEPAGEAPEIVLKTRRAELAGRTRNQVAYLRNILGHDITFGLGPAGTGKTFLAVACAVDALERGSVQRIILTRPAVEAGERLGFLPGDLAQKVDPYLRPLYDALYDLMGFDRVGKLFERGSIEIAPLAFMRGRTLNNAFIILDEAQNTTPEQMKMFLTRIGFGAKAVVTGDLTQVDLARGQRSGLKEARAVLAGVRGIAFTEFNKEDVVRHPLVARIVEAYDLEAARLEREKAVARAARQQPAAQEQEAEDGE